MIRVHTETLGENQLDPRVDQFRSHPCSDERGHERRDKILRNVEAKHQLFVFCARLTDSTDPADQ